MYAFFTGVNLPFKNLLGFGQYSEKIANLFTHFNFELIEKYKSFVLDRDIWARTVCINNNKSNSL